MGLDSRFRGNDKEEVVNWKWYNISIMNILICIRNIVLTKGVHRHPHLFTQAHIKKVKQAAGKKVQIVVARNQEEANIHAKNADIIAGFPMTMPSLADAKKLQWLHSFSAGVDRMLSNEVMRMPVKVSNSSGIHATPIAEHIIGMMLMFTRGFKKTFENQKKHVWQKDDSLSELRGKTVLIAGLGDIGMEAARLLKCFGARILAVSRSKKKKPAFVDELRRASSLDAMLPKADIVAICLPYTKDTHHFFDKKKFALMKQTAIVINIGRGGIMHEKDIISALRHKQIGGAGLDVTEQEPLSANSPLWDMENVIITPHHSGLSEKYMDRAVDLFCENLKLFLKKKPLRTEVDKKRGY